MLERFFLKPQTVDRIMGCWLGPEIELYVTVLCKQGYSIRSILRRVPILTEFAKFAEARNVNQIEQAEALIDAFVVDWVSARRTDRPAEARRRDRNFARGTVRHFFSLAISKSEYHRTKSSWADPFAAQVPGFFEYLREERGLRSSSIHHYQHYLRRFERYLDQAECRDLGALALPVVTGFVTTTAQEFGSRAMVCLASTLRVFLRYANREGVLRRDFSKLIEVPNIIASRTSRGRSAGILSRRCSTRSTGALPSADVITPCCCSWSRTGCAPARSQRSRSTTSTGSAIDYMCVSARPTTPQPIRWRPSSARPSSTT